MKVERTIAKRIVLHISRGTVHNGPGIRTLILFKGCPLRCLWCSTPESQMSKPEIAVFPNKCIQSGKCIPVCQLNAIHLSNNIISIDRSICNKCGECALICSSEAITLLGQSMTIEDLLKESIKDAAIFKQSGGGVTLSGGEPLLNPGFAGELINALKAEGISVGVDTCGHVPWANLQTVLPNIDFFLWDIKHMNPEKHAEFTGVSNELILSNARAVSEKNIPIYIRVPVIPGYNDSEENIRATADFARGLSSVIEINLLPLHHLGKSRYDSLDRVYPITDIPLIPDSVMQNMKQLVESYQLKCNIRGL
ncbi:glycyl-radical enzyme activating protein [Thermodesulfobacteriota bacterium]